MSTITAGVFAPPRGPIPGTAGLETTVVRTRLRLTRRGRAVLAALVVVPVVILLAILGLSGATAAADVGAAGGDFAHVTVQPGQTLWQIATEAAPDDDPRDVIQGIVDLNQLESSTVFAGESLAIPFEYDYGL